MKRLIFLLLLLGITGSVWGADRNWTNGNGNRLWRTAANWSGSVIPTSSDKAAIRNQAISGPIIDSSTTAVANQIVVGDWSSTKDTIDMTGGTLTTSGTSCWVILGYGSANKGTFTMSGGNATFGDNFYVGFNGKGLLQMTGGTITVGLVFGIAQNTGSIADVNLHGGTINANGTFNMTSGGGLDITTGTLIINGNVDATIATYISNGWITAYGGSGTVNHDYNITNPGKTTVTASSGSPPGQAANPNPANGATGVSITNDLSWTAGSGATSHDVYFGTSSPGTFRGNQTATTYDTGTMANNTTYYWRIDEKNAGGTTTGVVWSFTTAPAPPGQAANPNPANGATGVSTTNDLSWTAGSGATSHDVYFGTASPGAFQGNQTETTYDTGTMANSTTYYWRIDEKNASGTTNGDVWSFTTAAAPSGDRNWTNDSNDRLWRNPTNWSGNAVPTSADKAAIRNPAISGPIVDSSTTAVANEIVVGDWSSTQDTLDITGGTLTTNSWMILGYASGNNGTFTITGGTAIVGGNLFVGKSGAGTINITGGSLTVNITLSVAQEPNSIGNIFLDGGTINCAAFTMATGALMDVTGGTLIIDGDFTAAINTYIGNGWITAYSGSGSLNCDFGITNFGKTTLTATMPSSPPTKATNPNPPNNATGVGILPTLTWTKGDTASSRDVYFGPSNPPAFRQNQTALSFSPGVLLNNTVYYWRIDEKNILGTTTGDVWSFTTINDTNYSLVGKIMCGYQGWFNCPGDGTSRGWIHWSTSSSSFTPSNVKVDMWPDMTEMATSEKFLASAFNDGTDHYVFSSHKRDTVLRHFQWMQDYGIDGVFLQRFVTDCTPGSPGFNHRNDVLSYCKDGANLYGRKYAIMYDLGGLGAGETTKCSDDWKWLVDNGKVSKNPSYDPAYIFYKGKPVVAVYGVAFPSGRQYSHQEVKNLINFLKNDPTYGGNTVLIGCHSGWRTYNDTYVQQTLQLADIILPWLVNGFSNTSGVNNWASSKGVPDKNWCVTNGKDYMPVMWPGFSWHNMYPSDPLNEVPRNGGQFFWDQVYADIHTVTASMLYVAMFDEVDEGTAVFKITNDPPRPGGNDMFVTPDFDGYPLPSDEYLWLVGQASRGLRNEIPVNQTRPTRSETGVTRDWTNGNGNRLWGTAANWSGSAVPTEADKAAVRNSAINGPIISSGTNAVANEVVVGDLSSTHDTLDMTGGTLTTSGTNCWMILGYGSSNNGTFTISAGTVNIGNNLFIGYSGTGTLNMTGGTITVTSTFGVAQMTGGTGTANLNGGSITCGSFNMTSGGHMDITTGTLIINGDVTAAINGYASSGWITGYGGNGTVNVDYNTINPGKTTVTATSGSPPGQASNPSPANGANSVSTTADLSWSAGSGATSHDVYFGTASPGTFRGNQTSTTFDTGTMANGTIYYWRIDEKNANGTTQGIVWSFITADATGGDINWTNGGGNRLWRNSANWSGGAVPTSLDKAAIRNSAISGPIIDSSTTAVANQVVVGDFSSTHDTLDMTGGSLTTGSWVICGYGTANNGIFTVSAGTANIGGSLYIGNSGAGTLNMSGGTITVTGAFGVAQLTGSTGTANLNGGSITCGSFNMTSGGHMDITTGTLIISGDATTLVNGYVSSGQITAYGGNGTVNVDYNVTNPGKTTVTATPAPTTPTFVAAGAVSSGTGTITPALPSGIATGDILLLFVETANQAVSITNQNGGTWTEVTSSPQGTGTAGGSSATRLTVFWSRYNGTQGAPTVSDSGNHQLGRIIAIRGAAASGNPWNVTAGGVESTSDTSGSIPGATTTVGNILVVAAIATSLPDSTGTANFSSWANANLTSVTERTDNTVNAGNGGGLGIATGVKTSAGAYGNTAVTLATAASKGMMSIAIKP